MVELAINIAAFLFLAFIFGGAIYILHGVFGASAREAREESKKHSLEIARKLLKQTPKS